MAHVALEQAVSIPIRCGVPPKKTRAKRKANKGFQGISNSNHRRKKEKTPLKNKGKTPVKAKA